MQEDAKSRAVHENLDTSYVSVSALVRYLQGREFTGRVHVELDEYDADVFLSGNEAPRVRETDHTTGRTDESEEALRRLMVRATQPGGLVSVYEGAGELAAGGAGVASADDEAGAAGAEGAEERAWRDLLRLSGELLATVERGVRSMGGDFDAALGAARLELADDYSFLDPSAGRFEYANGALRLHAQPSMKSFVRSMVEVLRRVVDKSARGAGGMRVRERVALELAVLARRRQTQLAQFKLAAQLDRVAGTRVL